MSFGRVGTFARPIRQAVLFSATAHLFVLMAVGGRMASVVEESGVAGKKLQALSVSVSGAKVPAMVRHPAPLRRLQAPPKTVDHPSVVAMVDASPAPVALEAAPSGGMLPPLPTVVEANAPPSSTVGASVPTGKVGVSGKENALPEGYLDAVRGYRIALASHAKRFRLYPPAAREKGIGGRSEVEIVVPVSSLPQLRLRESSGHVELDRAALEMLRRSVENVEFPAQLKGRPLAISLPVEFLPPP